MPIHVDFSNTGTDEFAPLPEARYKVRVHDVTRETSKNGEGYLAWVLRVVAPKEFIGRRLWHNSSLQPQALWALKRLLLALGVGPEDLQGEIELEPADFIGIECVAQVAHETYQGEVRSRPVRFLPADTALDASEDSFDFSEVSVPTPGRKGGDLLE